MADHRPEELDQPFGCNLALSPARRMVKGSLITGEREWFVPEASLSPSQTEAAERVGRQFWTPGGGPVISAYPVPAA